MGILQSSKPSPSGPQSLSYTQAKQLTLQTKEHLTALRQELRLDLQFDTGSLRYNQRDWRKSTVEGMLSQGGEERVVLDLEQLYRLAEMLRHLKKPKTIETPTPSSAPEQDRECCICFAQKATTVLPCTHCFCATCTTRYIIEQQQHKCPTCRTEFAGSRDTLKRSFYQLIEEDREVYQQVRGVVLEMLSKYNTRVVRAIVHMEEAKK